MKTGYQRVLRKIRLELAISICDALGKNRSRFINNKKNPDCLRSGLQAKS